MKNQIKIDKNQGSNPDPKIFKTKPLPTYVPKPMSWYSKHLICHDNETLGTTRKCIGMEAEWKAKIKTQKYNIIMQILVWII